MTKMILSQGGQSFFRVATLLNPQGFSLDTLKIFYLYPFRIRIVPRSWSLMKRRLDSPHIISYQIVPRYIH